MTISEDEKKTLYSLLLRCFSRVELGVIFDHNGVLMTRYSTLSSTSLHAATWLLVIVVVLAVLAQICRNLFSTLR